MSSTPFPSSAHAVRTAARVPGRVTAPILALALVLTACGAPDDGPSGPDQTPAAASGTAEDGTTGAGAAASETAGPEPLAEFASPRAFAEEVVALPTVPFEANLAGDVQAPVTMAGRLVLAHTGTGVMAVDLGTAETVWETPFPDAPAEAQAHMFFDEVGPGGPVLSEDGSTSYATLPMELPGSGTTAASRVVRVLALDTATGEIRWQADVPQEGSGPDWAHVVSAADGRLVLKTPTHVAVLDEATHEVLWVRKAVLAAISRGSLLVLAEETGAGPTTYPQVSGLDPVTGDFLWSRGSELETSVLEVRATATPAGFAATLTDYGSVESQTVLLDPATGELVDAIDGIELVEPRVDGDTLYTEDHRALAALDAETLDLVWALPSEGREAPTRPVYFGGNVYGGGTDGAGVVLDGATGEDVLAGVPGTFVAVGEHGALMVWEDLLVFTPATDG